MKTVMGTCCWAGLCEGLLPIVAPGATHPQLMQNPHSRYLSKGKTQSGHEESLKKQSQKAPKALKHSGKVAWKHAGSMLSLKRAYTRVWSNSRRAELRHGQRLGAPRRRAWLPPPGATLGCGPSNALLVLQRTHTTCMNLVSAVTQTGSIGSPACHPGWSPRGQL